MTLLVLALMLPAPAAREDAMERCAEAVIARRHPNIGMVDMSGTKFEGMSVSAVGNGWVVIGAIVEPAGETRVSRRFRCTIRERREPVIAMLQTARR